MLIFRKEKEFFATWRLRVEEFTAALTQRRRGAEMACLEKRKKKNSLRLRVSASKISP
jgi:hypothetical protein